MAMTGNERKIHKNSLQGTIAGTVIAQLDVNKFTPNKKKWKTHGDLRAMASPLDTKSP